MLQGNVDGRVYRLAPPLRSQGVVAPYTGAEILFGAGMTGPEIGRRYHAGAQIVAQRPDGELPAGHDVLFRIRADGQLAAVTESGSPGRSRGYRPVARSGARNLMARRLRRARRVSVSAMPSGTTLPCSMSCASLPCPGPPRPARRSPPHAR
jgi:hypothetical protein